MKFLLLSILCFAVASAVNEVHTVGVTVEEHDLNRIKVDLDVPYVEGKYCAWARYNDSLASVGWGHVVVKAAATYSDDETRFCAGYAEGFLTHARIAQNQRLAYDDVIDPKTGDIPPALEKWMKKTIQYTYDQVNKLSGQDSYWRAVGDVLKHLEGIAAGYDKARDNGAGEQAIGTMQWWLLQAAGDLDDLTTIVARGNKELRSYLMSNEYKDTHHHCTGLVYVMPDYSDIFVAHDSWTAYNTMNRMIKEYNIVPMKDRTDVAAKRWTFSSNAGQILSMDDLWVMDSGLIISETTVHTWKEELYDRYCKPESVLSWIRIQVTNVLAHNGVEWAKIFNRENSWTYNNQYFVYDTSRFVPGSAPQEGFLYTAEQVPGYYVTGDRSAELGQRRWVPSINTPFYAEVYNASGYPEKVEETQCQYWSYENCSRHLIMKRDVINKINDYRSFQMFMRGNKWQTDPLSNGDAAQQILSRYDLRPKECLHMGTMTQCPNPFGGVDAKTVRVTQAKNLEWDAISSPQYEDQKVWEFGTGDWKDVKYDGLPKVWRFPWIHVAPFN